MWKIFKFIDNKTNKVKKESNTEIGKDQSILLVAFETQFRCGLYYLLTVRHWLLENSVSHENFNDAIMFVVET